MQCARLPATLPRAIIRESASASESNRRRSFSTCHTLAREWRRGYMKYTITQSIKRAKHSLLLRPSDSWPSRAPGSSASMALSPLGLLFLTRGWGNGCLMGVRVVHHLLLAKTKQSCLLGRGIVGNSPTLSTAGNLVFSFPFQTFFWTS